MAPLSRSLGGRDEMIAWKKLHLRQLFSSGPIRCLRGRSAAALGQPLAWGTILGRRKTLYTDSLRGTRRDSARKNLRSSPQRLAVRLCWTEGPFSTCGGQCRAEGKAVPLEGASAQATSSAHNTMGPTQAEWPMSHSGGPRARPQLHLSCGSAHAKWPPAGHLAPPLHFRRLAPTSWPAPQPPPAPERVPRPRPGC